MAQNYKYWRGSILNLWGQEEKKADSIKIDAIYVELMCVYMFKYRQTCPT